MATHSMGSIILNKDLVDGFYLYNRFFMGS